MGGGSMIGDIMSVSRLRMATDGQGVSTLVAFFDCPLECKYCINNSCHDTNNVFSSAPRAVYKPKELLEVLKKDEIYYLMTGGGVVFGGGEPLLQSARFKEGEDYRSLNKWCEVHRRTFTLDYKAVGLDFDEKGDCVLEEFEVMYP